MRVSSDVPEPEMQRYVTVASGQDARVSGKSILTHLVQPEDLYWHVQPLPSLGRVLITVSLQCRYPCRETL